MNGTSVLAKVEDIDNIMKQFYSFDKSVQLSIDQFGDGIVHFFDIKINDPETGLYYKNYSYWTVL